ncbi:hypothetical protein [Nostoc sp.]|uniref:hypothetical protein n=1 Tax=Nostoc sp. TaxID=1180 RepID=UPI002FFB1636
MKKTSQLSITFKDIIPAIELGQCYQNALVVADIYPQVEYVEGLAFNGERWLPHAWNCVNGDEFDLTFQIHFPHLLYCDRRIEIAGTLESLEAEGYSFSQGFAPLVEQGYRVAALKS